MPELWVYLAGIPVVMLVAYVSMKVNRKINPVLRSDAWDNDDTGLVIGAGFVWPLVVAGLTLFGVIAGLFQVVRWVGNRLAGWIALIVMEWRR